MPKEESAHRTIPTATDHSALLSAKLLDVWGIITANQDSAFQTNNTTSSGRVCEEGEIKLQGLLKGKGSSGASRHLNAPCKRSLSLAVGAILGSACNHVAITAQNGSHSE